MATKIIEELDQISNKRLILIGFLFLFILLTTFFIFSYNNKSDNISFKAKYKTVDGITINSPVSISGIKVGSIKNIFLNEDLTVSIEGDIFKNINIPSDSVLKIDTNGLFGKKYLSIIPGYDEYFDKSNFTFSYTSDSYTIDFLARYLESMLSEEN